MLLSLPTTIVIAALASGSGADPGDYVPPPPPTFPANDVTVDEQLGARVPLDVPLVDQDGVAVTLGELLAGDTPTILTFNYSSCKNMCSSQLTMLVGALPELAWKVGNQFRIVTLVIDPKESPERVRAMRARYVERLPAGSAAVGWTFAATRVPGDDAAIRRVADAVGYRYKLIPESGDWAHPASLVFLSPTGRVTTYVHGLQYDKDTLTKSIARAGTDELTTASGFLMRCFHWDPSANDYSKMGSSVLRYGAAVFLVIALSAFGAWQLVRRNRRLLSPGEGR